MSEMARAEQRVVRSRSHQVWWLIVAAVLVAFAVGFVVVAIGSSDPVPQIVAALIALGLAAAAVRWSFACAVFDYPVDMLKVRNPLRVHPVPLSQVYGFEAVRSWIPGGNGKIRYVAKVKRSDGSRLTIVGACAYGDTYLNRMIRELDAAYAARHVAKEGSA